MNTDKVRWIRFRNEEKEIKLLINKHKAPGSETRPGKCWHLDVLTIFEINHHENPKANTMQILRNALKGGGGSGHGLALCCIMWWGVWINVT